MEIKKKTRREFLNMTATGIAGIVLSACAPTNQTPVPPVVALAPNKGVLSQAQIDILPLNSSLPEGFPFVGKNIPTVQLDQIPPNAFPPEYRIPLEGVMVGKGDEIRIITPKGKITAQAHFYETAEALSRVLKAYGQQKPATIQAFGSSREGTWVGGNSATGIAFRWNGALSQWEPSNICSDIDIVVRSEAFPSKFAEAIRTNQSLADTPELVNLAKVMNAKNADIWFFDRNQPGQNPYNLWLDDAASPQVLKAAGVPFTKYEGDLTMWQNLRAGLDKLGNIWKTANDVWLPNVLGAVSFLAILKQVYDTTFILMEQANKTSSGLLHAKVLNGEKGSDTVSNIYQEAPQAYAAYMASLGYSGYSPEKANQFYLGRQWQVSSSTIKDKFSKWKQTNPNSPLCVVVDFAAGCINGDISAQFQFNGTELQNRVSRCVMPLAVVESPDGNGCAVIDTNTGKVITDQEHKKVAISTYAIYNGTTNIYGYTAEFSPKGDLLITREKATTLPFAR